MDTIELDKDSLALRQRISALIDDGDRFAMMEVAMCRVSVYTVGKQPCQDFLRGDADIAALGDGNRRNVHQCPTCEGRRSWCDNCCADHHEHGWESCKPGAYAERNENDESAFGPSEWIGPLAVASRRFEEQS